MFGIMRKIKRNVTDRTVYMEVYGENNVAYRVIAGKMEIFGDEINTYGIEAEDYGSGTIEAIPDFSHSLEDAVDFTEMLISGKVPPKHIYNKALSYLCVSI